MIAYFLVKVIVLFGLGSSGKMDRPSVDQTVVVDVFRRSEECERQRDYMLQTPIPGQTYVCVPVLER